MLPRLEDLQRMVSVALYGTNEDRARAEKEKIKNRHWSNRAAALPAGVVRTTSGRGARAAGSASADGGTTELVGALTGDTGCCGPASDSDAGESASVRRIGTLRITNLDSM